MSAQTDARRPADRTHSRRRGGVLDGGLSRLGTDGEGNLARALSHPLSDYYLVLANWKLGIVLEKTYAGAVTGGNADPQVIEAFGKMAPDLISTAARLAQSGQGA